MLIIGFIVDWEVFLISSEDIKLDLGFKWKVLTWIVKINCKHIIDIAAVSWIVTWWISWHRVVLKNWDDLL